MLQHLSFGRRLRPDHPDHARRYGRPFGNMVYTTNDFQVIPDPKMAIQYTPEVCQFISTFSAIKATWHHETSSLNVYGRQVDSTAGKKIGAEKIQKQGSNP